MPPPARTYHLYVHNNPINFVDPLGLTTLDEYEDQWKRSEDKPERLNQKLHRRDAGESKTYILTEQWGVVDLAHFHSASMKVRQVLADLEDRLGRKLTPVEASAVARQVMDEQYMGELEPEHWGKSPQWARLQFHSEEGKTKMDRLAKGTAEDLPSDALGVATGLTSYLEGDSLKQTQLDVLRSVGAVNNPATETSFEKIVTERGEMKKDATPGLGAYTRPFGTNPAAEPIIGKAPRYQDVLRRALGMSGEKLDRSSAKYSIRYQPPVPRGGSSPTLAGEAEVRRRN